MILCDDFLQEIDNMVAIHVPHGLESSDLAQIMDRAIRMEIPIISADPADVQILWTWAEKHPIKIFANVANCDIDKLSGQINSCFKNGAHGASVYVSVCDLGLFCDDMVHLRADLFFNRDLIVALDICEINDSDWDDVFVNLKKIKTDALMIRTNCDDFVGRIFGMLSHFNFDGMLYFNVANDIERAEQVWRLAQKIRPEIITRLRFFI